MGRDKGIIATGRFRFIEPCKLPWSRAGTFHKGNGTCLVFLWSKSFVTFILIFLSKKKRFSLCSKKYLLCRFACMACALEDSRESNVDYFDDSYSELWLVILFSIFFSFLTKVTFEVSRSTSSHYKVSMFRIPTLKLFQSLQMQTSGLLLHD